MQRPLPRGDQHALGHHEAQPHEFFAASAQFLMQVGQHADDLAAENIEPQVSVGAAEHFARQFGDRRVLRDPVAAAHVGQREMDPDPAGALIG